MTGRPLSVLFLTRYPVEGASSRYRVFQYLPHLRALGVECTVHSFMDGPMYRLSQQPGRIGAKLVATGLALLRRLRALRHWRRYDILYLQRELFPFGPPLIERWLKRRGAVLIFDCDDALFIAKPSRYTPLATLLRAPGKTREMFRLADCTVAGNDWLRDAARAAGGRAETVEVAEDTTRIPARAPCDAGAPVTIGWLGSPSTVKYLQLIAAPLARIAARHPDLRWEIMGGGAFAMPGVPWQLQDWSLAAEGAALARYDIGLMPLPQEDWSKGKSGGKARSYMAAGVVPVVAALGYNLELIRPGETGFLCATAEEWEDTIERLLADPALRARVGQAARAEVAARFAPARQAQRLFALFHDILATRKEAR